MEMVEIVADREELRAALIVSVVACGSFRSIKFAQVVDEVFASRI